MRCILSSKCPVAGQDAHKQISPNLPYEKSKKEYVFVREDFELCLIGELSFTYKKAMDAKHGLSEN